MTTPNRPRIVLHLEPLPVEGVSVAVRLRQALKTLVRRDRFRCVKVEGDGLDEPGETPADSEGRVER
jgi:hypothetical protein